MEVSVGEGVCIGLFVFGLVATVTGIMFPPGGTQLWCADPGETDIKAVDLSEFYYYYHDGCNYREGPLWLPAGILLNMVAALGFIVIDHRRIREGASEIRQAV